MGGFLCCWFCIIIYPLYNKAETLYNILILMGEGASATGGEGLFPEVEDMVAIRNLQIANSV